MSTGHWTSDLTGNPAIQLGDQWDLPAGDTCQDCLLLTLTIGDDPFELDHWTKRPISAPKPTAIAESALRNHEIEEDTEPPAPTPAPPTHPLHNTPPAAPPTNRNKTPSPRRNQRRGPPRNQQKPRQNKPPRQHLQPVTA